MSTFIQNTSPTLAKRIEKEITQEAIKEDKAVKQALKDLKHLEKQDNKAHKLTDKAAHALDKAERKEDSTLRALNKQANRHDDAVAQVKRRSRELDNLQHKEEKVGAALKNMRVEVEQVVHWKDEHEKQRLQRLEEAGGLAFASASSTLPQVTGANKAVTEGGPDPRQLH